MTYVPLALAQLQKYMGVQTGLPPNSLGVYPDEDHDGGYHCGWDRRRTDSSGNLDDYAWDESPRDWNHKSDAARAFDCGSFGRLQELSLWMVAQCEAGAQDTLGMREIIYSPDGRTVKRWDRLGIRSTGDSSHLTHTHFGYFADAEDEDKVHPFQRFFEGGGMSTLAEYNTSYMTQNAVAGLEEPNFTIPAGDGHAGQVLPNPLGIVLHAIMNGTDAQIPKYLQVPARVWANDTAARLARIESKLDALSLGGIDPEAIRAIVRQELDSTGLKGL